MDSAGQERAAELQDRVRLYVTVLFAVDVLAYISDFLNPILFGIVPTPLTGVPMVLRYSGTAATFLILIGLGTLTLPSWVSIAMEVGITLGLAINYVVIALAYVEIPELAPVFALLGMILLLVVRSSLVPSSVLRTAAVGIATLAILFTGAYDLLAELNPTVTDGTAFMGGAIVIATSVSSRVIYGLRERVRDLRRLGQYTLDGKLGEGGMGVVYRGHHAMLRRPTAIKLLPPERAGEDNIERFEREVRLTAQLTHPNTVTIFDYGRTPEGIFYYAMELLNGATLEQVVTLTGEQDERRTRDVLVDCAGALEEAHRIGLIHRDIKPSNIMLCRQGGRSDVAKLLDFGLVKQLETEEGVAGLTAAHSLLGTPMYMSPEAIRDPESVDARSDLYALGAVAYFLLTGTHVFTGKTVVEVCAQHLHEKPEPVSARRARAVTPALEALVLRCLEKDPERRPASARSFAALLEDVELHARFDADEWWDEYEGALEALRAEEQQSISGQTLAIAPR